MWTGQGNLVILAENTTDLVQGVSFPTSSSMGAGCILYSLYTLSTASSMDVKDVSLSTATSMDVQGVSLSTATSMDVQGVSLSTATSMDVQGVSLSTARSMEVQGAYLFHRQQYGCADCIPVHRLQCGSAGCMSPFSPLISVFKKPECQTVRHPVSPVPE
jgi:hypothetical protein